MSVVVREADDRFDRWDELHDLLMRSFAYMEGTIDPPSSLLRMDASALAAKAREEVLIVAVDDSALVGCVFVRPDADCAYIGKLAVDEAYRGRGIARRLLGAAESVATRKGRSVLTLQTRVELHENHAAFARLGFVKAGETTHAGYDRPTSVTMRKSLQSSL